MIDNLGLKLYRKKALTEHRDLWREPSDESFPTIICSNNNYKTINFDNIIDGDILIHVHGWLETEISGTRKAEYLRENIGDDINRDIISFCWPSNYPWKIVKNNINNKAVPTLISFIKNQREDIEIDLIGHSLGGDVVLKTIYLISLYYPEELEKIVNISVVGSGSPITLADIIENIESNEIINNFYYENDVVLEYLYKYRTGIKPVGSSKIKGKKFNNISVKPKNHVEYYSEDKFKKEFIKITNK